MLNNSSVRNHRHPLELQHILVIASRRAAVDNRYNRERYALAVAALNFPAQRLRRDHHLAHWRQRMRRPRIVGAGNAAHLAVPYIAKASSVAEHVELPRIPVL